MSQWNKAYLEALEVPVWVPLRDQVHEQSSDNKAEEKPASSKEESEELKDKALQFKILQGDSKARVAFLVAEDFDLKTALLTFQQMQFAWKAWLDEPLSAALIQSVQNPANDSTELFNIEQFSGQIIDCRESGEELDQPALNGPIFNFKQADKKSWWQLLQRLH